MNKQKCILKLYIYGHSVECNNAVKNLEKIHKEELSDVCDIEIIDIKEFPEKAEEEGLIAIPTLIRESPLPVCRIIGDLNDHNEIRAIIVDLFKSKN